MLHPENFHQVVNWILLCYMCALQCCEIVGQLQYCLFIKLTFLRYKARDEACEKKAKSHKTWSYGLINWHRSMSLFLTWHTIFH